MKTLALTLALFITTPAMAAAFDRITDRDTFLALIADKSISNRLYGVRLIVADSGEINGAAWGWDITGTWDWRDGYFCRQLYWGGDDIGYNCQMVSARSGDEMRFTSDMGVGDSASFKLR